MLKGRPLQGPKILLRVLVKEVIEGVVGHLARVKTYFLSNRSFGCSFENKYFI